MWTESELAYLAGILDGEGCFTLSKGSNGHTFGTLVVVGNTDARLIHWLQERFDGSVTVRPRNNPRQKPCWIWTLTGSDIEPFIGAVEPYLRLKREQALLLLEYRTTVIPGQKGGRSQGGHAKKTTPAIRANRLEMKSRLQLLNKRGA